MVRLGPAWCRRTISFRVGHAPQRPGSSVELYATMPVQIYYPKLVASRPVLRIRLPCSCMQHRPVKGTLGPYSDGLLRYQALSLQKKSRCRTEAAKDQSYAKGYNFMLLLVHNEFSCRPGTALQKQKECSDSKDKQVQKVAIQRLCV